MQTLPKPYNSSPKLRSQGPNTITKPPNSHHLSSQTLPLKQVHRVPKPSKPNPHIQDKKRWREQEKAGLANLPKKHTHTTPPNTEIPAQSNKIRGPRTITHPQILTTPYQAARIRLRSESITEESSATRVQLTKCQLTCPKHI